MSMAESREQFPDFLQQTAPDERVVGTFGWLFGVWGSLLLIQGVALFGLAAAGLIGLKLDVQQAPALIVLGSLQSAFGFLLVRHEYRRRESRPTLCLRGSRIGVYRRGKLEMESTLAALEPFDPSTQFISFAGRLPENAPKITRMAAFLLDVFMKLVGTRIKALLLTIPLLMFFLGGLGLAMAWFKPDEKVSITDQAGLFAAILTGAVTFASAVWTGLACKSFLLARKAGGPERFIAPRSQARRLAADGAGALPATGVERSARDVHPF